MIKVSQWSKHRKKRRLLTQFNNNAEWIGENVVTKIKNQVTFSTLVIPPASATNHSCL